MSAPLWTGWAVVRIHPDGSETTSTRWSGLTRQDAVRAYEKASTANSFTHHERIGVARAAEVQMTEVVR